MSTLAILGGGGHGSDVLAVVEACVEAGLLEVDVVVVSDDAWKRPDRFEHREVECVLGLLAPLVAGAAFVTGIGYPKSRHAVAKQAGETAALPCQALIHPASSIGAGAVLAEGTVVFGQVWLSPNAVLRQHVHVSYGSTIGHDSQIGAFSSVMPGANIAGDVTVGSDVMVGSGAVILEGLTIGDGVVIGAGSVVTTDIGAGQTVVGVPARKVQ